MFSKTPMNLEDEENRRVLKYLANEGAHPDLVEVLMSAIRPLGDAKVFYPGQAGGGCAAISTMDVIIAFGMGTEAIAFRLPREMHKAALAVGGIALPECGKNWIYFRPFRADWPKTDFEFWALRAYRYVREK